MLDHSCNENITFFSITFFGNTGEGLLFQKYLAENSYSQVQLIPLNIFKLKIPGVRRNTLKEFREKYLECMEYNKFYLAISLYEKIQSNSESNQIVNNEQQVIIDMQTMRLKNASIRELLRFEVSYLINALTNPSDNFRMVYNSLNDDTIRILFFRSNNYTLQKIGDELNFSRERIRQVQQKATTSFEPVLKHIFESYVNTSDFLEVTLLEEEFNENELFLIISLFKWSNSYDVAWNNKKIISRNLVQEEILNDSLDRLKMKDCIVEEDIDLILYELEQKSIFYITSADVEHELSESKFEKIDSKYYKMSSYTVPYLLAIEKNFSSGIILKQETVSSDYILLIKIASELYNELYIPATSRALTARLMEYLYAIDRSKYVVWSEERFDPNLIQAVETYVKESDESTFYFVELAKRFEKELSENGIRNRYHLHTIIRANYDYKYDIDRDKFTKKNTESISLSDWIEEKVKDENRVVSRSEILNWFSNFPDAMINTAIMNSPKLSIWGFAEYIHLDILPIISNHDYIRDLLISKIIDNHGYLSFKDIVCILKQEVDLGSFYLNETYLSRVSQFINVFFNDSLTVIDYGVTYKGCELEKLEIEDRLSHYISYAGYYDYNQFLLFVSRNNWNAGTIGLFTSFFEKNTLRVDENKYVLLKSLNDFVESEFNDFISDLKELENSGGLITVHTIIDNCRLPDIGIQWNVYSIQDFFLKDFQNQFTFYKPYNSDRRRVEGLIARKFTYLSFENVICSYMTELGINSIDEYELMSYLKKNRVINNRIMFDKSQRKYVEVIDGSVFFS